MFLEQINKTRLNPSMLDCLYDGEKLLQLLDQYKLPTERNLVKKYYIKNDEDYDDKYFFKYIYHTFKLLKKFLE